MFTGVIKSFRSSAESMRLMLGAGGKLVGGCVEEPKIFRCRFEIVAVDLQNRTTEITSSPANLRDLRRQFSRTKLITTDSSPEITKVVYGTKTDSYAGDIADAPQAI